ncbi:MAG: acetylornithine deacetylase, partial [Candidatus Methanomethylophilaceae archaeon]|nr:acetylornithine deacetylase [Candidatus Methanomethylophilaceae archaeon]
MVSLSEILTKIDGSADEMVRVMTEMIRIPALAPVNGGDGESKKADYLQSELVGFDSIVRVDVPDDVDPSVMRSNILAKK